ncbi:DUF5671 domain-containing protein [Glutamicibacter sp. MNS18]|uniref:DUF5671 domain-containing protein n=1 Tax=Glutamicibacter sp. MNS18 TaxID=2989817 RepID=UPI002235BF46|nr:DUF5671 domain-containing protein [Glutamicibacter sp. MNS18]MCW4465196.1 DUF5671 domain-containing protein [Glutamicibacter sp. MNS18]
MTTTGTSPSSLATTVRQLVLHGLLFILLMVFTTGLSSLITSALQGFAVDDFGSSPLPMALASLIIAGPLAWLLWRRIKVFLTGQGENASVIWSLQAAAVYAIATMVCAHYSSAVLGQWAGLRPTIWEDQLGSALAWGLLALWQYRILADGRLAPRLLRNLGWLVAGYYCLLVAALSFAALLAIAVRVLLPEGSQIQLSGAASLPAMANIGVWVVVNFLVWAWHWFRIPLSAARDFLAQLMLVLAVAASAVAALLGTVFSLASVLPVPVDPAALSTRMAEGLPVAAGFALAGALSWVYFAAVLAGGDRWLREAGRQVVSGISLAIAATGFGMIINALLATFSPSLVGNTPGDLLRIGICLFAIGMVAWMVFWRPAVHAPAEFRRIYLVLVFGVSAVVALVALLVVGYRIFSHFLTPDVAGPTLIGEVRAALGLLVATAAVFAYHFAIWRADREQLAGGPAGDRAQEDDVPAAATPVTRVPATRAAHRAAPASILLVTDTANAYLAAELQRATGIPVQHLIRTDMSSKPIPDVGTLASGIATLPAGTEQAMVILNGEYTMFLPLQPGTAGDGSGSG